jgi:hypothetical protein
MSVQLMLRAALDQRRGGAHLMSTNYVFDPEVVEALAAAFEKSWSFISNDPLFRNEDTRLLQRRLAQYLMQLTSEGERNPFQLANGAIGRMRHEHSLEAAL